LLNRYPDLRRFLRSPWWPDRINYGLTLGLFAVVIGVLWFGPQQRSQNVALTVFWAWWWPLILLGFPFVGRLWCAVCPFMIYGEVTQWVAQKAVSRSAKTLASTGSRSLGRLVSVCPVYPDSGVGRGVGIWRIRPISLPAYCC
jgi:polyferredoxin